MTAATRVAVFGATGTVGSTAVRRLLAKGDVEVVAVSRRPPALVGDERLRHIAVDLRDASAVAEALRSAGPFTSVVYAALYEKPSLVSGWTDAEQIATNRAMFAHVLAGLELSPDLHVSVLQGTKAYGYHLGRIPIPAKENSPRVEHPNFYWEQEDLLREAAATTGLRFTIFRPQFIFGDSLGVAMNLIPVIGVYAALRTEAGLPFSFPGGRSYVAEAVDSRLLATAFEWAARTPAASGETFNITNGDVFSWRDMWPAFARMLDVEVGADEPHSLAEWLPAQTAAWERVVTRHGLRSLRLPEILGYSSQFADDAFAYSADGTPLASRAEPVLLSTIKLRQAGFAECIDTERMFEHWFAQLRKNRIIP